MTLYIYLVYNICMIRINVYVTEEQYQALKTLVTSRVKLSEHIRRAIDDYVERYVDGYQDKRALVEHYRLGPEEGEATK